MGFRFAYWKIKMGSIKTVTCLCLLLAIVVSLSYPAVARAHESLPPEQIILTWTGDPATTQTVTWLMPSSISAKVQYLRAENFDDTDDAFDSAQEREIQGTAFDSGSTIYRYTANLTGLSPDTEYIYRAGREGAWSEPAAFTTAPAPPAAAGAGDFTFLYMGDVQAGYADWGNMLNSVYEAHPEIKFSLLGGDLTDKGNDENEWGEFLDAATAVFSRIPVMPALGNHDGKMYLKFFALPDNGPAGLKQEFYTFDYGDAHFVILDSSNNTSAAVKQWLRQDLETTDKKWKFAAFHYPAYPVVFDHKEISQSICENWVPILEENGVDMVFVGHQHVYMRTYPIYQGEIQDDAYGIVYVMGNAGSKIYGSGVAFSYIACERTGSNYQVIELADDVLTLTSREADGKLIETYTVDKGSQVQPEKPRYNIFPREDPLYSIGMSADGIKTMSVSPCQTGFKYFTVFIEPIIAHEGTETVVFTQFRNGIQLQLNSLVADFDMVKDAQGGFNVQDGDIIKVYLVDSLNNNAGFNPTVLH